MTPQTLPHHHPTKLIKISMEHDKGIDNKKKKTSFNVIYGLA